MHHAFISTTSILSAISVLLAAFLAFKMATKPSNSNLNGKSTVEGDLMELLLSSYPSLRIRCFFLHPSIYLKTITSKRLLCCNPNNRYINHLFLDKANFIANTPHPTVFKKPLALFSQSPMTGFYRDGYCRVGPEDGGNHAVAGTPPPILTLFLGLRKAVQNR